MRKNILAVLFLVVCFAVAAQQAMNNDAVIKMIKAGLSDDLIVTTIKNSPGTYDTSVNGLIALKQAGVSDKVVAAMVAKANAPAEAPAAAPTAATSTSKDPNDPNSPHDPGVYIMTAGSDGKPQMVFIDRAGAASAHTSNLLGAAFSYGISKAKIKAEIPGAHAPVRTKNLHPTFYMYFPSADIIGGFGGNSVITSPSQFSLLCLDIKKDHRETEIAKMGFASAQAGVDDKKAVQFATDRIRNGVYKITPNTDLHDGEYAFIAASGTAGTATAQTVVIYDFGVDH